MSASMESMELWPTQHGRGSGPPTRWERMRRRLRELPSATLLFVQLAALMAYPFIETLEIPNVRHFGRALFGLIGLIVLFLAVRAVRATPSSTLVAAILGGPVIALTIAEAAWPDTTAIVFWSSILHAAFYFYTAYALLRYMFADNWVTRDELFATGAAFTVFAWGYAYLYLAVQIVWPGSFVAYGDEVDPGQRTWFQLLFMSAATMTNTGLSDVAPILPHARAFVMLEMINGMLYVALVVARLVGLTIMRFR